MRNILKPIGLICFLAIHWGCDDYLDVNENPNGAAIPPLKGLLANATQNSAQNVFRFGSTTSFYVQYVASPNAVSATDVQERIDTSGSWNAIYSILSDIYDMEKFGSESNSVHYVGIAKTLTALNLGMAVDVWGDVPYDEALAFQTLNPGYDNQEELYSVILSTLDDAITELSKENVGEDVEADNDFIHGGNIEAWIKTANALKARYLNHYSDTESYDPSAIRTVLENAYTSNSDDAQVTKFENRNPWADVALDNEQLILGGWLSEQLIDAMNGMTFGVFDPRLPMITNPLPDSSYVGTVNGEGRTGDGTVQEETYLTTDGFYSSDESPLLVITYAELKFIEAEMELRDGNPETAYDAYLEGIRAHMAKLGVEATEIESYLTNPIVAVGSGNISLDLIFKEKYIAMFLNPESWVDARRHNYNYTDMTVPTNNDLGDEFIARYDYPDSEYQRNRSNVPSVSLLDRIFWDAE